MVPFHMGDAPLEDVLAQAASSATRRTATLRSRAGHPGVMTAHRGSWQLALDERSATQRARVPGRIRSMRVQPWADVATLECLVLDDTGGLVIVFLGRRAIPGVTLGRWLDAEGVVGESRGYLAI